MATVLLAIGVSQPEERNENKWGIVIPFDVNVDTKYSDAYAKYTAWSYACELTTLCDGTISIPDVKYERMVMGLRGYYDGSDTVYINRMLRKGVDRKSTLIHEMIHYIHAQKKMVFVPTPLGPSVRELCWSENEAFRLVDIWLLEQGYPEKVRGPNWWKAYWHCEPYYNDDFEIYDWFKRGLERF